MVHHTVVPYGGDPGAYMRRMQAARPDLGLEVPYSFVVMPGATDNDAVIGVGRGWGRTGAHTIGYNDTAYGVAFAGDYTDVAPTAAMFAAVRLIGSYMDAPEETLGHRDTYATACPGAATYPLLAELQPPFATPLAIQEEADMNVNELAIALTGGPADPDGIIRMDTSVGRWPLGLILAWTYDEIKRPDLLAQRIDDVITEESLVSESATADAIIDKLKERL